MHVISRASWRRVHTQHAVQGMGANQCTPCWHAPCAPCTMTTCPAPHAPCSVLPHFYGVHLVALNFSRGCPPCLVPHAVPVYPMPCLCLKPVACGLWLVTSSDLFLVACAPCLQPGTPGSGGFVCPRGPRHGMSYVSPSLCAGQCGAFRPFPMRRVWVAHGQGLKQWCVGWSALPDTRF